MAGRIRIVNRSRTEGKLLTGANTEIWVDGKKLPHVTRVILDIAAGDVARAIIEVLPEDIEFDATVDLTKEKAKASKKKRHVIGRFDRK